MTLFLGLEHEFIVREQGTQVDFRQILGEGGVSGIKVDPGDRNAHRTASGLVVTADGAEAEYACPPIEARAGFVRELLDWAGVGGSTLQKAVGPQRSLEGVSTHISVSAPSDRVNELARTFARTFAPAMMLLIDGRESPGLLVRPRHNRLEIGGDYASNNHLAAAAAMAVGGVRALLIGDAPDEIDVDIVPAVDRFGWYVDRTAFGGDLYSEGRRAIFRTADGDLIQAQDQLERCWKLAKDGLLGIAGPDDVAFADDVITGVSSLLCEATQSRAATHCESAPLVPEASLTHKITRPRFVAALEVGTWAHSVLKITGDRTAYVAIPRECLCEYVSDLKSGVLDRQIGKVLSKRDRGRGLGSFEQAAGGVAYFDKLSGWESLAPPEPHRDGVMRVAPSMTEGPPSQTPGSVGGTRTRGPSDADSTTGGPTRTGSTTSGGDDPPARPLKFLPPIEEPEKEIIKGFPWWPVSIALVSIIVVVVLIVILTGGGDTTKIAVPPTPTISVQPSVAPPSSAVAPPSAPVTPSSEAQSLPSAPLIFVPREYEPLAEILEAAGFKTIVGLILPQMRNDLMFDSFYSDSSEDAGNPGPDIDIWDAFVGRLVADQSWVDAIFNNSVFECGITANEMTTVCSEHEVLDMPAGDIVIVVQTVNAPIASEDWIYSYSAVLDGDGDPANNWQPQGRFDWDFFQGTDTWFVLDRSADGWTGGAYAGSFANPVPSAFRAVIFDTTIVWFLAGDEVPAADGAQTTAFRHDGSFAPEASAADVLGANPTEPLMPLVDLDVTLTIGDDETSSTEAPTVGSTTAVSEPPTSEPQ